MWEWENLVTLATQTRKPFTTFIGQLFLLESVLAIHVAHSVMQYFTLQLVQISPLTNVYPSKIIPCRVLWT